MAFIGYRNDGRDERRFGRRVPAGDIPISWVTPKSAGFGLGVRSRARSAPSSTPRSPGLRPPGLAHPVRGRHHRGLPVRGARLQRHRAPPASHRGPAVDLFGLELVVVHPLLKRRIQQLVGDARTEVP